MADMNKIKRIDGGVLKTQRAQDATIPLNVQTYDGSYTVTPTREQQTLATRNMMMTNNVTVEAAAITTDYDELENKPQINSVTLQGNVGLDQLGIPTIASVEDKYTVPEGGIPASDLAEGVIPDVSGFYTKPSGGIPADDIADGVIPDVSGKLDAPSVAGTLGQVLTSDGEGGQTWEDPTGGGTTDYTDLDNKPTINSVTLEGDLSLSDLGIAAESDIPDVSGFYTVPSGGIPASDMASAVQTSLGKADTAYQKPSGGIPSTDIASGVIPDVSGKLDAPSTAGTSGQVLTSDGQGGQSWQTPSGGGAVNDVQIDGTSILSSGVANIPVASGSTFGVLKTGTSYGTSVTSGGVVRTYEADASTIKAGTNGYQPITPSGQHAAAFYGLAKAAGDTTQKSSSNEIGTYTADAKAAIQTMLGVPSTGDISGFYTKPSGGIPSSDMASAVQTSLGKADTAYQLPSGGMTSSDMASAVQTSLGKADTAYQKPSGGIPSTDMTSAVQTSLGKADTAYQKPSGGIPGTDLASGVIPTVPSASDATPQALGSAAAGSSSNYSRADHVHAKPSAADIGAIPTPSTAGTNGQVLTSDGNGGQSWQTPSSGNVIPEYTMTSASTATCNMTFAQVSAAVLAGKCDQAVMTYNGAEYTFHLDHRYTSDSSLSFYYIDVSTASVPPKYIGKHYILHGSNGNIGLEQFYVNEISDVTVNGSSVLSNGVAAITVPDVSGKLDAPTTAGTNGQVLTSNGSGGQTWQTISGLLPSVSSSDNGKFLRVSNGAWAAETVPTAVGVSF